MRADFSSNFLTRRSAYSSSSLGLTETQVRMDANLRHFTEEASDISNLVAMTTGSLAFKFTQTGLGSLGLFKHASSVLALGVEATVYRGSSNLLAEARGLTPAENVFDGRGWVTTFTHFGALKGASYFVRGKNVFFSHTVQSLGMVGGSQLTYAMHLTARPHGSFFEQMMEAERTNIALGAGTALMGRLTGHRLQVIEKSLDLRAEVLSARPSISGYEKTFLPAPALWRMGATEEGITPAFETLREAAINEFWSNQLNRGEAGEAYLKSNPEASRLLRALQAAESEIGDATPSRRDFLNLVLRKLKSTQGVSSYEYKSRYALEEMVEKHDVGISHSIKTKETNPARSAWRKVLNQVGAENVEQTLALFGRYLARYPIEDRGGIDFGTRVNEGRPHRVLEIALQALPTNEKGDLIEVHDGKSLQERLQTVRRLLDEENVRLVTVWGAGRHGLALGDWIRQAAGRGEMIDGKYVIPIMLGHRPDFTYELNMDGSNEKQLSGIPINEPGRLALRAAHPRQNKAYLALAETVIVTLPSTELKKELSDEVIRNMDSRTQFIFAIKSVLDRGESIPGYVMERLARLGRFDLMLNAAFQSGLGFPKEMFGRLAPDAPVNLAVDAMTVEAAVRASKTLIGDRAEIATSSPQKRTLTSNNKRIDAGVLVFKGAYGGFIKNFISPWVGYRLMDYYVQNLPHVTSTMMRSKLADLQAEAVELSERIFNHFEAAAIHREMDKVVAAMDASSSGEESSERRQSREWTDKVRNRLTKYRDRVTATEDLLGCTRIRDMDVYMRIVGDLLEARGLTFERRLSELTARVRSLASSTNFAYGLLEPIYLELVRKGMLVERPKRDFTTEGINGLPNAEARWGSRPEFVKETLAWVHPAIEPRGQPALHSSGLRLHVLRVTRDLIDEMENHTHPIVLNQLTAKNQRSHVQEMQSLGKEMISRLRREMTLFPPASDDLATRIQTTLLDFDRFLLDGEKLMKGLDYSQPETTVAIKKYVIQFRRVLTKVREQLSGNEDWIEEKAMDDIRENMTQALQHLRGSQPQ